MQKRFVAASVAALATVSIGLAGCSSSEPETAAAQGPDVTVAVPASPERVDAAAFSEIVAAPGVQVIDVRSPEEFAEGHIEGAVNFNVQGPDFLDQISTLDPASTYAVYCRSGNRSQPAVATMADNGITSIYELESGIVGWQDSGLPTVQ